MALDSSNLPIWLAKLDQVRAEFTVADWPKTPTEGLLATCQLSDDVRTLAIAGLRHQHPSASVEELETLLDQFRTKWEQICPRFRIQDIPFNKQT